MLTLIRCHSSSLSDEDAVRLLQNLVGWLLRAVEENAGSSQLLLRKLCSALSTFFIHFSHLWKHCVRHLVQCFDAGRCIPIQDFDEGVPVWMAANSLSPDKLQAMICFASDLADNVERTDPNSAKLYVFGSVTLQIRPTITDYGQCRPTLPCHGECQRRGGTALHWHG